MKRVILVLLCCMAVCGSFAQATKIIKGAVVDKNGNPLPGAQVEATGGAESVIVDADGTFSMEVPIWLQSLTVKYAGMKDAKMKVKDGDMIFFMKPYVRNCWFVNAVYSCVFAGSEDDHIQVLEYAMRAGVMFGYLGNWGGYAKILPTFDADGTPAVTVGVTKRLSRIFHIYAGVGYAPIIEESWWSWKHGIDAYDGTMFDVGVICKPTEHLNLNLGVSYANEFDGLHSFEAHVGIGYAF